jgi:hypothetical protein
MDGCWPDPDTGRFIRAEAPRRFDRELAALQPVA